MQNECLVHKIKNLISDSENYEYYIHLDNPMITEDLFNKAIELSVLHKEKLNKETKNFIIKKLFFRNLSKYKDELKIIIPQGFYQIPCDGSWFEKHGQNEMVQIHLPETDDTLMKFCHPFIINLTNEVENNMLKQLANLKTTPFEDRTAENYQMYCNDNLLVAEIINELLITCSAYSVSVITR